MIFLRELEADKKLRAEKDYNFDQYLRQINQLLDNIKICRNSKEQAFSIYSKEVGEIVSPDKISSGESELIALAIECLVFEKRAEEGKENILLLDEPDVHLHPDLQARFSEFLLATVEASSKSIKVIVATHSTAIVGAMGSNDLVSIEFMSSKQVAVDFKKISEVYRKILPIFGVHPLSNVFNKTPIFLVEGDDEERIWQQAIRTSEGRLRLYPCSADGIDNLPRYERAVEEIIKSVYDEAQAFSLRDSDDGRSIPTHLKIIEGFILGCRTSENLLLSNEVLEYLGKTWEDVKTKIEAWLADAENHNHKNFKVMQQFKSEGFPRKTFSLKELRNILIYFLETNKGWETLLGQVIGTLIKNEKAPGSNPDENSIFSYLGDKLNKKIFPNSV